jgi:Histidine kinase-, DNA gyrase B-, and HSP90-like ATPase
MGSMLEPSDPIPISGSVRLTPEPRSLEALGRNHTLEAALAELVDNSIDAEATQVLIRFVKESGRLTRLFVVDDGIGMDDEQINVAMTVGGNRTYGEGEIGRFGLGLKAASFSQAHSVTVISVSEDGEPTGRVWMSDKAKSDYECQIVAPDFAGDTLRLDWGIEGLRTGTVIRWDDVKGFPAVDDEGAVERFLQDVIAKVRTHIGLVFHRILEAEQMSVRIDTVDNDEVLPGVEVGPLDPFGYPHSGAPGWPKALTATGTRASLDLDCHIWPGRSSLDTFRLDGDQIKRQGIYVYYNDRLVQLGGWNGLMPADKQLSLARVAVDIDGDLERMVSLKPEKNGIEVGADFSRAIWSAETSDGAGVREFIDEARGVLKASNRRTRRRSPVMPPGAGFPPRVRRAFERELPIRDEEPVEIRWQELKGDEFFEVDRELNVLWLNSRYRKGIAGGRRGALNDSPVVKALMFLLMEEIFSGQNMGPRDKDNVEIWQAVLTAAAREELG